MANWEWRLFYPADKSSPNGDIWSLLGLSSGRAEAERTDVYLSCTAGAGLKLRHQKDLEVKLRQSIALNGAEQWIKVVSKSVPRGVDSQSSPVITDLFKRELSKLQSQFGDSVLNQVVEDSIETLSTPQRFVKITKSRRKKHALGISIEETAIRMNDSCEAAWISVCLESHRLEDIDKALSVRAAGQGMTVKEVLLGIEGARLEAYPLFIMTSNT